MRLAGRGSPGERGGPAGDLLVAVNVTPHAVFGRRGARPALTLPVTYPEAALGAQVAGADAGRAGHAARCPPGTTTGRTFRVRGRGVPKKDGCGRPARHRRGGGAQGDVDRGARARWRRYAAAAPYDPRAHLREVTL